MRQDYQGKVPQGMSSGTDLGGTLVPRRVLGRGGLTKPRLIELRFGRWLRRGWILGYAWQQGEPEYAHDPKWGECLTDGGDRANMQLRIAELVCMHGLDEHEACHLLWVRRGVQLHDQPPIGVPHQDIGTRDASPGQERVQFGDHAPSRAWQGTIWSEPK